MKSSGMPIACWLLVAATCGALLAEESAAPQPVRLNGHTFALPAGFEVELAAGPPLVERPITADFDERGRLYVAESSGSNEKVELQLEKKPHRILRLEDSDGDGRFENRTVFAEGLMLPEGTMWFQGSLYVAAPPSIWKFTDTNDDGVADLRSEWFQGKTLTGCANDLHGPYAGPDGWIYWCKGAFVKQTYTLSDGSAWSTRASHIFRCRPDGSGLESVMTGGMDNPVDVAFLPSGDRFVSCTFLQHPGGGRRDGLLHAVYGGVYGKEHEPIHEHRWTGPELMPVLSHLGPAAPCGLASYEANTLGEGYRGNLFTACFNMRKVTRTVLTPAGASYTAEESDFLVSDHIDFHPTDVLEDADGSLLVVDTGGWYKLCCPTSQIEKPDVPGAIYRVKRIGSAKIDDPRGRRIPWGQLSPTDCTSLLDDSRPSVQRTAIATLGAQGERACDALRTCLAEHPSPVARRNAVWALCRIEPATARELARAALSDRDASVRYVAAQAAALHRDAGACDGLLSMLSGDARERRMAAEALGRLQNSAIVPQLAQALAAIPAAGEPDRALKHSLLFALIELNDEPALQPLLRHPQGEVRRGALIALDQLSSPRLTPDDVIPELAAESPSLRAAAIWILGRHPAWGPQLVEEFRERLRENPAAPLDMQLASIAKSAEIQNLLAETLGDGQTAAAREIALAAMVQANPSQVPAAWRAALAKRLAADQSLDSRYLQAARLLMRTGGASAELERELLRIGGDSSLPPADRVLALSALSGGVQSMSPELFEFLLPLVERSAHPQLCSAVVEIFAASKLSRGQRLALCDQLGQVGPLEADGLLKTLGKSADDEVGLRLIATLQASAVSKSLPVGLLRERLQKFGPAVQQQAAALYAALDVSAAQQKEKLEATLKQLPAGDIRRGQMVFHSAKAACASCHAIGYTDRAIGPDLTRIGAVRSERDLLESVLFPSNSFVQGFEPSVVITTDGITYSGLLRRNATDDYTLITGATQSVRLASEDIEETHFSAVSLMPAGLDGQLTLQQLADLLAYLRSCR